MELQRLGAIAHAPAVFPMLLSSSGAPTMKTSLLLAEGDAELCEDYQRFLRECGYEVETASDGLDCLAKLRRGLPGVLVLDWELRWGGGDGVLAWLREQSPASELPVVLMSTGGYSTDVALEIKPPVVKFLPKPFTLSALLETVRDAVLKKGRDEPLYAYRAATCWEMFIG
jgi:DNA-binding NtrC family response regulator